ncbi:MAG: ABC transporter substrate-binding protein [Solirubrobacteraceae bacterium]
MTHAPYSSTTSRRAFLRRGAAGVAIVLGGSTLLAACGDDATAGGATEVGVSLPTGGNSLSIWRPISEKLGLADPAVSLKWAGGDPGQLQTQFLAGSVDISTFGPLGVALSQIKGEPISIVGPGINAHHKWLVPASSSARKVADLRGKRVATGLNTSEVHRATQLVIAIQGGDPLKDIEWIHAKGASANALFERGDVDAIYVGEPNATILVSQGARQIGSLQAEWASATGSDVPLFNAGPTVRDTWANENPAAAVAAVGILTKASIAVAEDPSQLTDVAKSIGVKPTEREAPKLLPKRMADVYQTGLDGPARDQLDEVVRLGVKHGILPKAPPAKPLRDLPAAS